MPLYIGKKYQGATTPVQSIFRLAGSDEDALTHALGFLLSHDGALCRKLLKHLGIRNRKGLKSGYSVHLQEVTGKEFGRRDIVIEYRKTRIVPEAKIDAAASSHSSTKQPQNSPENNPLQLNLACAGPLWDLYLEIDTRIPITSLVS